MFCTTALFTWKLDPTDVSCMAGHANVRTTLLMYVGTTAGGLDHGGAEGDLMELNGWTSPQMLRRYGASARSARARRSYDRIMENRP